MNLRRISSSLAAAALIAGLAGTAPAGVASADGGKHRQDTGWGLTAHQADPRSSSPTPGDTGWGSINDTGWGIV